MPLVIQNMAAQPFEPMDLEEEENVAEDVAYSVENAALDLDAYSAVYRGLAKIQRLIFIADHCSSLRQEALAQALTYVTEQTYNTVMYQEIQKRLQQLPNSAVVNGPDISSSHKQGAPDLTWIEQTTKRAQLKLDKLDTDLKHYKSNSIKESIRRGQDDLGEHYLDMGDLTNALKCFSRSRDYCTTNKHFITMCFNVIKVSAYLQNWSMVLSYVSRAENTTELSQPGATKDFSATRQQIMSKLHCAAGLAELHNQKFKQAARHFLQVSFDHLDYPELISASNVAAYGSLCALASFDRQELKKNVISNTGFKQFLELEPQLNDMLIKFYESRYAACLRVLNEIKDNLLLDIYLSSHVNKLYTMIRNRGLIQYFSPYLSARMDKMAEAFNTSVPNLENELTTLILDGLVKGRIDSHNKIIYAKDVDQRASAFENAVSICRAHEQRVKALMIRAAVHKAQVNVKCPPRSEAGASDAPVVAPCNNSASSSPVPAN